MKIRKSISVYLRFWKYVAKSAGCWLWIGAKTNGGYGVIQSGSRGVGLLRAHRLSWEIHNGSPPDDGLDVCHHCDNPSCVNPGHLFLGSAKDNVADMVKKGRASGGSGRGEQHHRSKLTDESVKQIRAEYATGKTSLSKLAEKHSVSKKTILNVIHLKIWTHV